MWRAEGGGGNKDCFVCRATMYSCSAEKALRNWGVLATAVAFYAEQSCKAEKARRMYAKTGKRRQRSLCI